jgi:hypothetical protein
MEDTYISDSNAIADEVGTNLSSLPLVASPLCNFIYDAS